MPDRLEKTVSELRRNQSTVADALSGDPRRAALASAISGCLQALLLLPMNTVQTQMQTRGLGFVGTIKANFTTGAFSGLRNLYRALLPTVGMLGARQGLKFGSASAFKRSLPLSWPEVVRDVVAGASSATATTTIVFPLDTLKTRMQNGLAMPPTLSGFYSGYTPAAFYSALGMGLWVGSRNKLERDIRYNGPGKHLLTGAIAGVFVQLPTFPLDTLKKRLQSSDARLSPINEARTLMAEGGVLRFYKGFPVKCLFVAFNGAIFNSVFVAVRKALHILEDEQAAKRAIGPVDASITR